MRVIFVLAILFSPLLSEGTTVTNKSQLNPSFSGDFNQDGQADLLLQAKIKTGSAVSVALFNNLGEISEERFIAALTDKKAKVVGVGFYNADAFLDVLIQSGNKVSYLPMGSNLIGGAQVELGSLKKGFKVVVFGEDGKKYKFKQGKLVTKDFETVDLDLYKKLDQNLGKIVAVENVASHSAPSLIFQKKEQAFQLKFEGAVMPLSISGLGPKKKIVGPR